jgi:hypothetical protein
VVGVAALISLSIWMIYKLTPAPEKLPDDNATTTSSPAIDTSSMATEPGTGTGVDTFDPGDINSIEPGIGGAPGGRMIKDKVEVTLINGKKPKQLPTVKCETAESAKIFVDLTINDQGKVIEARIGERTTTKSRALTSVALGESRRLIFDPGEKNAVSTVLFQFINND